jgi:hypothetical protein
VYTPKGAIPKSMSPQAGFILQEEVVPRLRSAIPNTVPLVGADNVEELVQDGTVLALRLLNSAKRSGRKVTGGNLAFYTLQTLRSGRRSTPQRKNDPPNPYAQLRGACKVQSLDEPLLAEKGSDEPLTLGETLAARTEDPCTVATRHLDWAALVEALDKTAAEILSCLIIGADLTTLVPKLKRSRSALRGDKDRLAQLVLEHLGEDILARVQESPRWQSDVAANREKLACRCDRRAT